MFLMKSRCPGASMMVMLYFWVLNFSSEMSMVIPRSRSAFSLSSTQANLKELFPIWKSGNSLKAKATVAAHLAPHLRRALLELVQPPLVDASALVDQVTGGGGLPAVHVPDYHHIHVGLLLPHDPVCVSGAGKFARWTKQPLRLCQVLDSNGGGLGHHLLL